MARGFKNPNNYTPGSRNPLARTIRAAGFRTRVVKSKKGKGSYKRKGRIERFFLSHDVNLVIGRDIMCIIIVRSCETRLREQKEKDYD